jgi:4-hydroxybenzoate polyprenyltransferase
LTGFALGAGAAALAGSFLPAAVTAVLVSCILVYDGFLKKTRVGPLGMGACRAVNVLLGMSAAGAPLLMERGGTSPPLPWEGAHWLVAGAIGLYIAGVTWFARGEAGRSRRLALSLATVVMLAGIALLWLLPSSVRTPVAMIREEPWRWNLLVGILAAFTALRCVGAIRDPRPRNVQGTVARLIYTLFFLDAAACFVVQGIFGAAAVLLLVLPASILGQWLYWT